MGLYLKHSVYIFGLSPEMVLGVLVAQGVYEEMGYPCVVTSGLDGRHMRGSLHYKGRAVDLRTKHLDAEHVEPIAHELQVRLGPDFDVVLEPDHIHVEFDPKAVRLGQ